MEKIDSPLLKPTENKEKTSGNQPEVIHQSKNEQYFLRQAEKLIL